jgi:hypothetical protein
MFEAGAYVVPPRFQPRSGVRSVAALRGACPDRSGTAWVVDDSVGDAVSESQAETAAEGNWRLGRWNDALAVAVRGFPGKYPAVWLTRSGGIASDDTI